MISKMVAVIITIWLVVDNKIELLKRTIYYRLKHNNKIKIYPAKKSIENDAGSWVKINTLF